MSDKGQPKVHPKESLHKSAGERAFELFFCAAREVEGVGAKGAIALQDLLSKSSQPTATEIISTIFSGQSEQPTENADAENQASQDPGV